MRKTFAFLVLTALAATLWVGCSDDQDRVPYLSAASANVTCGVAPMLVQFVATASGGDRLDNPTGANDYLEILWNFGDNTTTTGSLVYHVYQTPGDYQVEVRVKDKDGEGDPRHISVQVRADSLTVRAYPDTTVRAGQPVPLTMFAETCGFDKNSPTHLYQQRFLFRWESDGAVPQVFTGRSPTIAFTCRDMGTRHVYLRVTDDQYSLIRRDTLTIVVENEPPVAVDDVYTVAPTAVLNVAAPGVRANDSDAEGCALTVTLVPGSGPTQHEGGAFTLNANGSFLYNPINTFTGTDSFRYLLSDGALTAEATVTINVQAP